MIIIYILGVVAALFVIAFYLDYIHEPRKTKKLRKKFLNDYNDALKKGDFNKVVSIGRSFIVSRTADKSDLKLLYNHSLMIIKEYPSLKPYALAIGRKY